MTKIEQTLKELSELQRFYAKIPKINKRPKNLSKRVSRKKVKSENSILKENG